MDNGSNALALNSLVEAAHQILACSNLARAWFTVMSHELVESECRASPAHLTRLGTFSEVLGDRIVSMSHDIEASLLTLRMATPAATVDDMRRACMHTASLLAHMGEGFRKRTFRYVHREDFNNDFVSQLDQLDSTVFELLAIAKGP